MTSGCSRSLPGHRAGTGPCWGRAGAAVHHTPAPGARGYFCTPTAWGLWCPLGAFTGWEGCRGLLHEAGLCSLCWSWEDPEGSRRNDDPSCASDPDRDIFKQGIKIDLGWRRTLTPGIAVKGAGGWEGGQGGPHPIHPSPPTMDSPSWLALRVVFVSPPAPWGLSPCPGHPLALQMAGWCCGAASAPQKMLPDVLGEDAGAAGHGTRLQWGFVSAE